MEMHSHWVNGTVHVKPATFQNKGRPACGKSCTYYTHTAYCAVFIVHVWMTTSTVLVRMLSNFAHIKITLSCDWTQCDSTSCDSPQHVTIMRKQRVNQMKMLLFTGRGKWVTCEVFVQMIQKSVTVESWGDLRFIMRRNKNVTFVSVILWNNCDFPSIVRNFQHF